MRLAVLLLLVACASRTDRVERALAEGRRAEVVAEIDTLEKEGKLGKHAAELKKLRDDTAFALAMEQDSSAALLAYRWRYPESGRAAEALARAQEIGFQEAMTAGTAEALRAYRARWPDGPYAKRAGDIEEGMAFQEAGKDPTGEAMRRFVAEHPNSPYRDAAWETSAAHAEGVVLRGVDGEPIRIPAVPVMDGRVKAPMLWPVGPSRPRFAVNVKGAANGATSTWWRLEGLDAEGRIGAPSPVAAKVADLTGVAAPPRALELVPVTGVHLARIAQTAQPLVVPGACTGRARFALVLERPGEAAMAWPFAVDCPTRADEPAAAATLLVTALASVEAGVPDIAAWDAFRAAEDAGPWLEALGADTWSRLLASRPAAGDVVAWTVDPPASWWIHAGSPPRVLATRAAAWPAAPPTSERPALLGAVDAPVTGWVVVSPREVRSAWGAFLALPKAPPAPSAAP